jgi:8-oxo-dGTP pyrophosphatase MutT (NUDIX family)
MATSNKVEHPVSAGGVVYRVDGGEVDVVICGARSHDGWIWGLPKGTPDPGETLEETAIREVTEETGLKVTLEAPIDSVQYWFVRPNDGVRCHKTVHFYLMSAVGGSFGDHDHEFDEVRWSHGEESLRTLTYKNEIDILGKAIEMVSQRARKEGASD